MLLLPLCSEHDYAIIQSPPSPKPPIVLLPPLLQEVNSVESMKNAVEVGLGVAFVSRSAVEKEVALGSLAVLTVAGVPLQRTLLCVTDPVRYSSKAVHAFIQEMFNVAIPNSGQTTAAGGFLPDKVRATAIDMPLKVFNQKFHDFSLLYE